MAEGTGRFWWSQVAGPATLVRESVRVLVARGSVLLSLPPEVPFEDDFDAQMRLELTTFADTRELVVERMGATGADVVASVLERADEAARNRYRPAREPFCDYARRKGILRGRVLWVEPADEPALDAWLAFADAWRPTEPGEGLVLVAFRGALPEAHAGREGLVAYDRQVGPRSLALFCAVLMDDPAHADLSERCRLYASSLVARLSLDRPDVARSLADDVVATLVDPGRALHALERPGARTADDEIATRVWQAQVESLFGILEQERLEFVERHEEELGRILARGGVTGRFGRGFETPMDLELGDLVWLATSAPKGMRVRGASAQELAHLRLLRDCRNLIAHHKPCPPSKVSRLLELRGQGGRRG